MKFFGILIFLINLIVFSDLAAATGDVSFSEDGVTIVDSNRSNTERTIQGLDCSNEGTLQILTIDPPEGTILKVGNTYTFTLMVRYEFETSTSGKIGILARDEESYRNLDNQIQDGVDVFSVTGEEIVSVTTTISLDGKPVDGVVVSASLFAQNTYCTSVSSQIGYSTNSRAINVLPVILGLLLN